RGAPVDVGRHHGRRSRGLQPLGRRPRDERRPQLRGRARRRTAGSRGRGSAGGAPRDLDERRHRRSQSVTRAVSNSAAAVAAAPARAFARPGILRGRDFRRFWLGESISLVGDQITLIALPLVGVLALHADAAEMGYLGAAALLPNLLFSLHAGAWLDRRGRRREAMIATALGRAALLATIPIAYWFGLLSMAQLYVVSFLIGTLSVLFFVAYSTLFASLVPRDRYLEATSLLNGSRAFSFVAGPSIGGLLVQVFSAPGALIADALSFLVSA